MVDKKLMELAKYATKVATDAGANDARVFVSRSRGVSVEWRDGKLDRVSESISQGLNIKLYVENRYSSNSTSDIRKNSIEEYVKTAVASTKYLAPDKYRTLPEPDTYKNAITTDLGRYDSAIEKVTPEQRLKIAKELEDASRVDDKDNKIVSVETWVTDSESRWVGFSTNGFEAGDVGTRFSHGSSVSINDTKERKPSGWDYGRTRFLSDLPNVQTLGKEAFKRAIDQLGSQQTDTGEYDIIIENRAVPTFARHLLSPLSGGVIQQKRSFFENKLGEKVGSKLLSIKSDPHLIRGLASSRWDSEGMVVKPKPIFEKGVLKTFFLNTYYAAKLGKKPNSSKKGNLIWQLGKQDTATMISKMKNGIFVTGFLGGNSNSTTGDFSLGIKGHLVKNGKIIQPISEMNIAGNHLEFWNNLIEVGNDIWKYSSNRAPALKFRKVQCSGS